MKIMRECSTEEFGQMLYESLVVAMLRAGEHPDVQPWAHLPPVRRHVYTEVGRNLLGWLQNEPIGPTSPGVVLGLDKPAEPNVTPGNGS